MRKGDRYVEIARVIGFLDARAVHIMWTADSSGFTDCCPMTNTESGALKKESQRSSQDIFSVRNSHARKSDRGSLAIESY